MLKLGQCAGEADIDQQRCTAGYEHVVVRGVVPDIDDMHHSGSSLLTTASTKRAQGRDVRYPHRRKFYRTTVWKATGMKQEGDRLRLSRARGLEPISVALPPELAALPPASFVEMRLVYDCIGKRHQWHLVLDDGRVAPEPSGLSTLAADLGEIHPAAVANEQGAVVIFTARELRALNQYRNKKLASLQAALARKQKGSMPRNH